MQPANPTVDDEEDLPFGEGPPFAHEAGDVGDEFPLDEFDLVPGYGEDVELPPYPEDETGTLRKRSVPRSLVAVAGILAVVLVGVLAFVLLRHGSGTGGAPPIIAADAGPTKIAPPQPPAGSNNDQNKLIYDRVDSGSANGAADTKLVTQGNQPIAPVPSSNDANNPIARVIAPGGPAPDAPATPGAPPATANAASADTAAPPADSNDNGDSLGPRKVRTVIVKPDGTIVSSDAVPAPGDAPASTDAAPTASNVPAVPPIPTNDDTAAIAGGKSGQELPITPDANAPSVGNAAAPAPTPAKTAAAPAPQPKAAPKVASTDNGSGPMDLTQSASQPSTDGASAGQSGGGAIPVVAGGTLVQVSSQRSEDAANATFRDLQARYPNILGGYSPDIKKIDLGDRGTYYRVRVGPFSSANAQSMCSALKNAGGNCILAH